MTAPHFAAGLPPRKAPSRPLPSRHRRGKLMLALHPVLAGGRGRACLGCASSPALGDAVGEAEWIVD
ncbi:hypothetical protein B0H10DRAFT_2220403 [Mycena sp. CBHHK59/15]|nr:hypothetical protein B0H10DRAFT_2220403 [Mycena sp. CBHHK59/15]